MTGSDRRFDTEKLATEKMQDVHSLKRLLEYAEISACDLHLWLTGQLIAAAVLSVSNTVDEASVPHTNDSDHSA